MPAAPVSIEKGRWSIYGPNLIERRGGALRLPAAACGSKREENRGKPQPSTGATDWEGIRRCIYSVELVCLFSCVLFVGLLQAALFFLLALVCWSAATAMPLEIHRTQTGVRPATGIYNYYCTCTSGSGS
jgi:hypothetical protein